MNVSLTPELEKLVTDKVKTGLYQTASEVIRDGLRLLRERDEQAASFRGDVQAGFAAVESGEFTDYDETSLKTLVGGIRTRGAMRLAGENLKFSTK